MSNKKKIIIVIITILLDKMKKECYIKLTKQ